MAKKRKVAPMETRPIRSQIEAATPMAPAPSKPTKAVRRSTPPITQSQAAAARRRSLKKQRSMLSAGSAT
jgi:hypothetical protein